MRWPTHIIDCGHGWIAIATMPLKCSHAVQSPPSRQRARTVSEGFAKAFQEAAGAVNVLTAGVTSKNRASALAIGDAFEVRLLAVVAVL